MKRSLLLAALLAATVTAQAAPINPRFCSTLGDFGALMATSRDTGILENTALDGVRGNFTRDLVPTLEAITDQIYTNPRWVAMNGAQTRVALIEVCRAQR